MDGGNTILKTVHVEMATIKIDGVPRQGDHFRDPQAVVIGHQDQRGVAMTMASLTSSGSNQPLNLVLSKILPRTDVGVLRLARRRLSRKRRLARPA
jgi:hypothetical protein